MFGELIDLFEDHDCDTIDECRGYDPSLDQAVGIWQEQFKD